MYLGRLKQWEIDYVAKKNNKQVYIQAAYIIADESTQNRKLGNLLKIEDNFPKDLVSMDPIVPPEKGINLLKLKDFLLLENL